MHFAWLIYNNYSRYGIPIDIVTHSAGGLITRVAITGSRYAKQGFPPCVFVEDVVTLATPHDGRGTLNAWCDSSGGCDQMYANSPFMTTWINPYGNPQAAGLGTDWTAATDGDDCCVDSNSGLDIHNVNQFGHKVLYLSGRNLGHSPMHSTDTGTYNVRTCDWNTGGCDPTSPNSYISRGGFLPPVQEALQAVDFTGWSPWRRVGGEAGRWQVEPAQRFKIGR